MYYKDKSGHFTTKENNGKECPHDKYKEMSIDELKGITQKTPIIEKVLQSNENNELDLIMGKEYKGVKGQAAVNKLMKEKNGHVKAAFHREDFGDIDVLWGNENLGLCHIIIQRSKQGIDGVEFLSNIAEVIENGEYKGKNGNNTFEIWHNGKMAIISPEYHGKKITFLLTAFKKTKNKGSHTATL